MFDDRALARLLHAAEDNLAKLQFPDQASLIGALGRVQGSTLDTSSLAFSLTPVPPPATTTVTTTYPNAKDKDNTVKTVTGATATFTAPTTPAPATTLSAPSVGVVAQDVLSEQVALQFQVINLRLMLQGALSDRISQGVFQVGSDTLPYNLPRMQAVLGFQVSIDPRNEQKDCAAEVEVTVSPDSGVDRYRTRGAELRSLSGEHAASGKSADENGSAGSMPPLPGGGDPQDANRISLVALFPQEKTYNVASMTQDAKSLGLGAFIQQVVSVGITAGSSSQKLFLVKDVDTVALERPATERNAARFLWQFRPVLGRRVVDPGIRQVYALLSLPRTPGTDFSAHVTVRRTWRKYDRGRNIVGPETTPCAPEDSARISFPGPETKEDWLRPKTLLRPDWRDLGNGQVQVTVNGANFLPDTVVYLGDSPLTTANGLVVQGDDRVIFNAPATLVASNSIRLLGAYGPPQPLQDSTSKAADPPALTLNPPTVTPVDAVNSRVQVTASFPQTIKPVIEKIMVLVGPKVYGLNDAPITRKPLWNDGQPSGVEISFIAPLQSLRDAKRLKVLEPFRGPQYAADVEIPLGADFEVSKVILLASDSSEAHLAITGRAFQTGIKVSADGKTYEEGKGLVLQDSTLLTLDIRQEDLQGVEQLLLQQSPMGNVVTVVVPLSSPLPIPTPAIGQVDKTLKGDSKPIKITGTNLNSILRIEFEGTALPDLQIADDGKSLTVRITDAVTREVSDNRQLNLVLKNGQVVPYALRVEPRP